MKKVFNASLLAASMAVAFSAGAAEIISTPLKLSSEGIQAGNTLTTTFANFKFDVKVDQTHASGSEIVLTFTKDGLDLTGVGGGACSAPTAGVQTCDDIELNVGNGNFTFDNAVVDAAAGTVKFNVQLGNAITPASAFRVAIKDATLKGQVTASYASNLAGTAIESTSKALTTSESQFSYAVTTKLDGVIERPLTRATFVNPTAVVDTLVFTATNNTALLLAATPGNVTLELGGNFKLGNGPVAAWVLPAEEAGSAINAAETLLTKTLTAANAFAVAPAANTHTVTFTRAAGLLQATNFDLTVKQVVTGVADPITYLSKVDAGKWAIDATVVNVPYLPIGYAQFSPVVEISNLGSTDAEVIIEAVGKTGTKYAAKVLAKKAAKGAVTSFFESDIMTAFGLSKGSNEKLSVTFSIDAQSDDITLVPYYREGESRVGVISSQYKN